MYILKKLWTFPPFIKHGETAMVKNITCYNNPRPPTSFLKTSIALVYFSNQVWSSKTASRTFQEDDLLRNEVMCASPTSEVTLAHIRLHVVFHSQRSDRATVAPHSIPVMFLCTHLHTLNCAQTRTHTHGTVMSCHNRNWKISTLDVCICELVQYKGT